MGFGFVAWLVFGVFGTRVEGFGRRVQGGSGQGLGFQVHAGGAAKSIDIFSDAMRFRVHGLGFEALLDPGMSVLTAISPV